MVVIACEIMATCREDVVSTETRQIRWPMIPQEERGGQERGRDTMATYHKDVCLRRDKADQKAKNSIARQSAGKVQGIYSKEVQARWIKTKQDQMKLRQLDVAGEIWKWDSNQINYGTNAYGNQLSRERDAKVHNTDWSYVRNFLVKKCNETSPRNPSWSLLHSRFIQDNKQCK